MQNDDRAILIQSTALGAAHVKALSEKLGLLAGQFDGLPAMYVAGDAENSSAAFAMPKDQASADWLQRCRGQIAPGVHVSVGKLQGDFRWIGPGAETARTLQAKLPPLPTAWAHHIAMRGASGE